MSSTKHGTRNSGATIGTFCVRYHRAVEIVGKRWSGVIIRLLLGGDLRYNELAAAIPGISDRLLCERLRDLENEGLVRREVSDGPPVRVTYSLTKAGADLEPVVRDIAAWAERWIPQPQTRTRKNAKS